MGEETFQQFIARWIGQYGTANALATAIGMSLSAFSRGVRNAGTLGVENLLRLAQETGEPPSKVLRIAGKEDVADLIEHLYGRALTAAAGRLSGPERELITLWGGLNPEKQQPIMIILRALSEIERKQRLHA